MKNIIKLIGVAAFALTMLVNISFSDSDNTNNSLVTLTSIANANAADGERYKLAICIENGITSVSCNTPAPDGSCDQKANCGQ